MWFNCSLCFRHWLNIQKIILPNRMTSISAFVKRKWNHITSSGLISYVWNNNYWNIFLNKHILTSYKNVTSFRGRTGGLWSKIITAIILILYCLDWGKYFWAFFFSVIRNKSWTRRLLRCNGGKRGGKSICVGQAKTSAPRGEGKSKEWSCLKQNRNNPLPLRFPSGILQETTLFLTACLCMCTLSVKEGDR